MQSFRNIVFDVHLSTRRSLRSGGVGGEVKVKCAGSTLGHKTNSRLKAASPE